MADPGGVRSEAAILCRSNAQSRVLEEQCRLCYVGMTRATRREPYLTYAEVRRLYGQENYTRPSRFIREVPAEYAEEIRMRGTVSQPMFVRESAGGGDPAGSGSASTSCTRNSAKEWC